MSERLTHLSEDGKADMVDVSEKSVTTRTATASGAVVMKRETLDLILTTPIQPGPYIAGKMRGLVLYLLPMIIVPVVTLGLLAVYVLAFGALVHVYVTKVEEKELLQRFGASYQRYCESVPRWVPKRPR